MGDEKGMETILSKNNLIQDSEGKEENRHSAVDSNKTKVNGTKEHKDAPLRSNPASNH
jgi:hypothetical protein